MQKLAAKFVPAADACDRMQKKFCQDADANGTSVCVTRTYGREMLLGVCEAGDGVESAA